MSDAVNYRQTSGSREFKRVRRGQRVQVNVTADRGRVVVYVHANAGFGGSSRRVDLGAVPDEVLSLMAHDPDGGALADALAECGLDDGAADVIRNGNG